MCASPRMGGIKIPAKSGRTQALRFSASVIQFLARGIFGDCPGKDNACTMRLPTKVSTVQAESESRAISVLSAS